jgi:tRNA(Ile)-lysidine synthase TilS/MesJ
MLRGDAEHIFVQPGEGRDGLPVIAPFIGIPEDDIALYVQERGLIPCGSSRSPGPDAFGKEMKAMLDAYTGRHPATKYSLLHLGMSIRNAGAADCVPSAESARGGDLSGDGYPRYIPGGDRQ